jgi:hypothetical protein
MKMSFFRDIAPCSLVKVNPRFRGAHWLRHQGDHPDEGLLQRDYMVL